MNLHLLNWRHCNPPRVEPSSGLCADPDALQLPGREISMNVTANRRRWPHSSAFPREAGVNAPRCVLIQWKSDDIFVFQTGGRVKAAAYLCGCYQTVTFWDGWKSLLCRPGLWKVNSGMESESVISSFQVFNIPPLARVRTSAQWLPHTENT